MSIAIQSKTDNGLEFDAAALAVPSAGGITGSQRKALHDAVAEMSATEAEFRAELVSDPKGTLEACAQKILGRSLEMSAQGRVIVLDDAYDQLNVVLPIEGSARAATLEMGALTPLLRKAGEDAVFRQAVVSSPQETVGQFYKDAGTPIPDFVKIKVVEISDHDAIVFMPPQQSVRGEAASEVTATQNEPRMWHTEGGCYTMYCRTSDDCHQTNTTTLNASCPTFTYQPRC